MTDYAAIKATWATYKPVPTRSILQLVLEVPLEQQEDVFKRLGYPVPGKETWVGVALLNVQKEQKEQEKQRQPWSSMTRAQQAGILCADERFQQWLGCDGDEAEAFTAAEVRAICGVKSRAEIDGNPQAEVQWDNLVQGYREETGQFAEQRG